MVSLDLSRDAVSAWLSAQPASLAQIVRELGAAEGWIDKSSDETWTEMAAVLTKADSEAISFQADDVFVESLLVMLAHCDADTRLRVLVWLSEGSQARAELGRALIEGRPQPTDIEARAAFDVLHAYMNQLKMRRIFARVFAPNRLDQVLKAAQRVDS